MRRVLKSIGVAVAASPIIAVGSDSVEAQVGAGVEFISPCAGAVLQGTVEIQGTLSAISFLSAELGSS